MTGVPEIFGSLVFDERQMKARLSSENYLSLRRTIEEAEELDINLANQVAAAMKEWAVQNGATHYTHWFQPMTGITAEKHDSFIEPSPDGGVIMEFSGKELIKGEPDASSFPSGGLRSTFEARGYTAWDPTSYAFIKDKTLCIPTAFCSYTGEALDKKTPLLRSIKALNKQSLRILKLFGHSDVKRVTASVGPEQEYFIIDKDLYEKRPDLINTGRTLFGAKPPKGQELDDHYFGTIPPRVQDFMTELNEELWKLGVLAKTEHNEVAPGQHELAPIYSTINMATDQNQVTMEMMQRIALKHGLVCLLHEKPFAGVNGSGKHNNYSITTNTGMNLFSPGETPYDNAQFLTFLTAFIKAVDTYQDLLRTSVASAGNDHRLGANEAPPAVISIFVGDELARILQAIETDEPYSATERRTIKLGVNVLPKFASDNTDRNRTSPVAFTGNKFEFRMVGSSQSIADPNIILNTSVAEVLKEFADELEGANDFEKALHDLIRKTLIEHKRIIFNGNGYDDAWIEEATTQRGLLNLKTTPDALRTLLEEKNVKLFTDNKIYTPAEMVSRHEILLENYVKTVAIEANTMIDMARKLIIPAIEEYVSSIVKTAKGKKLIEVDITYEKAKIEKISAILSQAEEGCEALEEAMAKLSTITESVEAADFVKDEVIAKMNELRVACDEAEGQTAKKYWPIPSYADLLFSVK